MKKIDYGRRKQNDQGIAHPYAELDAGFLASLEVEDANGGNGAQKGGDCSGDERNEKRVLDCGHQGGVSLHHSGEEVGVKLG